MNFFFLKKKKETYLSTRNIQLHLTTVRTHQRRKLITHTTQHPQPVILRQRGQEVLEDIALVRAAGDLLQLAHDHLLVGRRERRRRDDRRQLAVCLQRLAEAG